MDAAEIEPMLTRHHRGRFRPWLCRCGLRYPCGPRLLALDERLHVQARAAQERIVEYFAGDTHTELRALARLRDPGQWS